LFLQNSSIHTLHSAAPLGFATVLLTTPATPFLHETAIAFCFVFGWWRS